MSDIKGKFKNQFIMYQRIYITQSCNMAFNGIA